MKRWQALSGVPFASSSHLDLIMAARCAAEEDGLPVYSTVTVHAAYGITPDSADGLKNPARAVFDDIMARPEAYANPELDAQMAWKYPDPLSARKPLKLTVSGLLRELEGPEQVQALLERPAFMTEVPAG
jgi:hypothetical protein